LVRWKRLERQQLPEVVTVGPPTGVLEFGAFWLELESQLELEALVSVPSIRMDAVEAIELLSGATGPIRPIPPDRTCSQLKLSLTLT
jgi:hypothetical protein